MFPSGRKKKQLFLSASYLCSLCVLISGISLESLHTYIFPLETCCTLYAHVSLRVNNVFYSLIPWLLGGVVVSVALTKLFMVLMEYAWQMSQGCWQRAAEIPLLGFYDLCACEGCFSNLTLVSLSRLEDSSVQEWIPMLYCDRLANYDTLWNKYMPLYPR